MAYLEVIARVAVRPGQLDGFKAQAAEIIRLTQELDTRTLRCDWFMNEDETACEVHETFADEHGLIEHQMHIMEARSVLFRDHASDHRSTIYGEVTEQFLGLVKERMGAAPSVFSFFHRLGESAPV
jgi:hypothetical protein